MGNYKCEMMFYNFISRWVMVMVIESKEKVYE